MREILNVFLFLFLLWYTDILEYLQMHNLQINQLYLCQIFKNVDEVLKIY